MPHSIMRWLNASFCYCGCGKCVYCPRYARPCFSEKEKTLLQREKECNFVSHAVFLPLHLHPILPLFCRWSLWVSACQDGCETNVCQTAAKNMETFSSLWKKNWIYRSNDKLLFLCPLFCNQRNDCAAVISPDSVRIFWLWDEPCQIYDGGSHFPRRIER